MRKSKVVSISLPPRVFQELKQIMKEKHQNCSEVVKNLVHGFIQNKALATDGSTKVYLEKEPIYNLSQVLKLYYDLVRQQKRQIIVVGLGIIVKNNKVLIGKRGVPDPYVKHLSWVFPGGRLKSLSFTKELKEIVKEETGFNIEVGRLFHTRLHPDNLSNKVDIVALYFYCEVIDGKEKPGGLKREIPLIKLKWVTPTTVTKYFTTSTADEVMQFLKLIELSRK